MNPLKTKWLTHLWEEPLSLFWLTDLDISNGDAFNVFMWKIVTSSYPNSGEKNVVIRLNIQVE